MAITPRTLEQLAGKLTSYEVGLYKDGELLEALAFSERKTRGLLMDVARRNGERIAAMMTEAELNQRWTYRDGALSFGSVAVAFTGQTERSRACDLLPAA